MWPHAFGAAFTAKSGDTLRRNAVIMPLYTLTLAFVFFVGFTAVMVVPGLPNGDLALLTLVRKSFPPWFLGVIGGAGALTAMVPAAIFILTAATLFAKNLYRPIFAPAMTDRQVGALARVMVVVLGSDQSLPCDLQFDHAGVAASDGLRGCDAILSRSGIGPLLATRLNVRSLRRHGRGDHDRGLSDAHPSRPVPWLQCGLHGSVP